MNKKQIILFILFTAIACSSYYAYTEYNRKTPDLKNIKADETITATELIDQFVNNEQKTNNKYFNKILSVTGIIKEIQKSDSINTVVIGDTTSMNSVRCTMDMLHQKQATILTTGTIVTIKGICTGFNPDELLGSDVVLNRCFIQSK
ncbi:MAG TPA: hypothetical protein VFN30_15050 [Chitinophagaceae bacterium]|nr:hypothetical protein [Chitinophagaceae bacterium]